MSEISPNKTVELPTTMKRAGAKRVRVYYGPFEILGAEAAKNALNPMRMDPGSTTWSKIANGLPVDSTILKTNTSLQLLDGSPADIGAGIYNHHVVFFDQSKNSPIVTRCGNGSMLPEAFRPKTMPMTIFGGTSEDNSNMLYSDADGTFNSGFWLPKTDKMMIMGEIINYRNSSTFVYSVTDVEYVPGQAAGMLDAYTTVLDVAMCGGTDAKKMFQPDSVKEKKFSAISNPMIVTQNGWLIHKNGHLHDGGDVILMKVSGKVVCESKAKYGGGSQVLKGEDGKVWETLSFMEECNDAIKLKEGDQIEIEARYDFEAHPARKHAVEDGRMAEVMGLFGATFAPDPNGTGGKLS
ncbi:hypothetical protein FKW77_000302 [Venturia effusa]|uniref:Uncharacterized protein n=1 Tax=Venturia effusa TaxID=50376 RepID=A0A517LJJ3_9PEZI|nr:hypothetical protein FKW77_000302 [Venturia effusa]